jgi:hypothetical protein
MGDVASSWWVIIAARGHQHDVVARKYSYPSANSAPASYLVQIQIVRWRNIWSNPNRTLTSEIQIGS